MRSTHWHVGPKWSQRASPALVALLLFVPIAVAQPDSEAPAAALDRLVNELLKSKVDLGPAELTQLSESFLPRDERDAWRCACVKRICESAAEHRPKNCDQLRRTLCPPEEVPAPPVEAPPEQPTVETPPEKPPVVEPAGVTAADLVAETDRQELVRKFLIVAESQPVSPSEQFVLWAKGVPWASLLSDSADLEELQKDEWHVPPWQMPGWILARLTDERPPGFREASAYWHKLTEARALFRAGAGGRDAFPATGDDPSRVDQHDVEATFDVVDELLRRAMRVDIGPLAPRSADPCSTEPDRPALYNCWAKRFQHKNCWRWELACRSLVGTAATEDAAAAVWPQLRTALRERLGNLTNPVFNRLLPDGCPQLRTWAPVVSKLTPLSRADDMPDLGALELGTDYRDQDACDQLFGRMQRAKAAWAGADSSSVATLAELQTYFQPRMQPPRIGLYLELCKGSVGAQPVVAGVWLVDETGTKLVKHAFAAPDLKAVIEQVNRGASQATGFAHTVVALDRRLTVDELRQLFKTLLVKPPNSLTFTAAGSALKKGCWKQDDSYRYLWQPEPVFLWEARVPDSSSPEWDKSGGLGQCVLRLRGASEKVPGDPRDPAEVAGKLWFLLVGADLGRK